MKRSLVLLLGSLFLAGCGTQTPAGPQATDPGFYQGASNSKVTIVEYSDLECPACGSLHRTVLPALKAEYVSNNKVRFEFRDFPLPFHGRAISAAQATYCAGEQGQDKYWAMQDAIYADQSDLTDAGLSAKAEGLGINMDEYNQCYADKRYQEVIESNFQKGLDAGVEATPTMFINDIKVVGTQSIEDYRALIDQELGEE